MSVALDKALLEDQRSNMRSDITSEASGSIEPSGSARPRRMSRLQRMNSKLSEIREKSLSNERR